MTPSFDPARLAELPADLRAELRALFEAQRAMLEAERIRADHELAARLHIESELAASKETVERLQLLVKEYERARFGKRSEKLDPDQLQLVLEDIEIAIAEVQEREDDRARRPRRARLSCSSAARRACDRAREPRLSLRLRPDGSDRRGPLQPPRRDAGAISRHRDRAGPATLVRMDARASPRRRLPRI
jgi:transposase